MSAPEPGLRSLIEIAGYQFSRNPQTFGVLDPEPAEKLQRTLSTALRRDVLIPFTAAADRPLKFRFQLGWSTLSAADQAMIWQLNGAVGGFDFTPWIEISEQFLIPSSTAYSGTLARRIGLSTATYTPTDSANRVTRLTIAGTTKTLVAGTVANYRTPWTATGTAGGTAEQAIVWYSPTFRVMLSRSQIDYGEQHKTKASLTLEEV